MDWILKEYLDTLQNDDTQIEFSTTADGECVLKPIEVHQYIVLCSLDRISKPNNENKSDYYNSMKISTSRLNSDFTYNYTICKSDDEIEIQAIRIRSRFYQIQEYKYRKLKNGETQITVQNWLNYDQPMACSLDEFSAFIHGYRYGYSSNYSRNQRFSK